MVLRDSFSGQTLLRPAGGALPLVSREGMTGRERYPMGDALVWISMGAYIVETAPLLEPPSPPSVRHRYHIAEGASSSSHVCQ